MRTFLKWIGILLLLLVVIVVIAGVVLYVIGRNNLNRTYANVTAEGVPLLDSEEAFAAAQARGEHLAFAISLCAECHGDDLGGKSFLDQAIFGSGDAPNLTSGQGGIGGIYSTEDWVRALRHGVKPDNTSIRLMPADKFYHLSDDDLVAIIAYVQNVPPVDRETEPLKLGPLGTIIAGVAMDLPAKAIDHTAERPAAVEPGVTAEYGKYLVTIAACQDCHGEKLDGKVSPLMPAAPDLRPGDGLAGWTEAEFANTMRTGVTPYGKVLDHEEMPWNYYTRMTDDELSAIWAYLQTLQ